MRKFLKIYPSLNDAVRHHDKAAAEYTKAKERYEKLNRGAAADDKIEKVGGAFVCAAVSFWCLVSRQPACSLSADNSSSFPPLPLRKE